MISVPLINDVLVQQLVIWGMKCIDYDYDFEKHLADNLAAANTRLKAK